MDPNDLRKIADFIELLNQASASTGVDIPSGTKLHLDGDTPGSLVVFDGDYVLDIAR